MRTQIARSLTISWLAVTLVACGALGLVMPDTFNEKVLAVGGALVLARTDAKILLDAEKISSEDAQNAQDQVALLTEGVVLAREIYVDAPAAGESRLDSVVKALESLQRYLDERKKDKP